MKQLKLFFALFAMLALGVGNAWAEELEVIETLNLSASATINATPITVGGVLSITGTKGTNNFPVFNYNSTKGVDLRFYQGTSCSVTFTAKEGYKLEQIVFKKNTSTASTLSNISVNSGTLNSNVWTASESTESVTFTYNSSSNFTEQIYKIYVTYSSTSSGGTEPPTPTTQYTIKWHTAKGVTTDVTLNEGATITKPATDPTMTGYEFMGWTASCDVASDGSDFTALTDFGTADSDKDFYAVFAVATTTGGESTATEVTDVLNRATTGITNTSYAEWSGKTATSSAVYAGQSAGGNTSIQLRSSNSNSGIVTTASGGKATKISVVWNTNTTSGRTIDIYGKNSAYSQATDLYNSTNQGTKLGSIKYGTSTELAISGDYEYIGIRSNSGALYLTSVSITWAAEGTSGGTTTYSGYITTCSTQPVYSVTLNQPANGTISAEGLTDGKAAEGVVVKLTATPNAGYKWESWTVTGASGNVEVSKNQFTMPAEDVTVSATFVEKEQYAITWSVNGELKTLSPSSVAEGEEIGTLPEAEDCPDGKVFMGWTAANEVNPNGLGIEYAKATDIPTDHTTYNAVYAKETIGSGEEGSAEVALTSGVYDSTNKNITWTTDGYATILQTKGTSSTDVGNYVDAPRWYVGHNVTITPQSGVNITKIVINQGSDSKYQEFANATINNATITIDEQIITITPNDGTVAVTIEPGKQLRPTAITIHKGPSTSYSHYSFDCEVVTYLNVDPTTITFDATNVGFNSTKTIDITAGYLTEDITLAISGANANEFSVSTAKITKDEEVSQEVTVTYAPTAEGNHNATLNITSGSTLSKTIALTGSATEATIYTLTALADINPTDKVIIVGTSGGSTYAMSNDKGTNGAPTAVAVTVADNKIATNATNILWNIDKNGDNLTIYPADQTAKWLYCTNTNNGVRVGTGEAKEFTMNSGYLYTEGTTDPRYVGIYNTADWRCYTTITGTSNIADQSFAFYVLPSTDPVINVTPASKDFGAVIVGNTLTQEFEISTLNVTSALTAEITGDACFTTTGINAGKITVTYAPTAVGNYTATLTITAGTEATKTIELKGEAVETVNVATAMAAAKDEIVYLKPFDVVYAVTGKEYVYIKDESGFGLIYDTDLANQLLNGYRVEGFVGKSSPYRSLPELKAHNTENMTITHGTAVEPTELTTVPATSHVNQYVVFKNVTFDEDVVFNSSTATNATFKLNTNDVTLRNSFKFEVAFEADKAYDIYGAIATYQATESDPIEVQVYYLNSAEAGQEVVTYTVTYDANGASGNVPTDLANYAAGQQVTVAGQGEMTYENHMFTGWKYNGTIYQADDKFNMPADDVTLVAQWEERQTFSSGLWVLVTDASELAANDYIIVAAAEENFAMKSYESGNNCKQVAITKFGNNNCFLTWTEEIGVFQLLANGSNYTIQDVNTKQYLYAAGSGNNNYLKASYDIATDENASKYVWTIAVDENGIATVKATSENRNTLMYNTGSDLFSCYASGQKDIVLYKYVTDFYTRDVTKNQYGTICLDKGGVPVSGATFYEVAYKNTQTKRVLVDEVVRLKAGVPYVFLPNATQIKIALDGTTAGTASKVNGLQGTFDEIKDGPAGTAGNILEGKHVLYNNAIQKCGGNCKLPAYRAYFLVDEITTTEPAQVPGRRRVALDYQGENQATGLDNIGAPENDAVKVLMNGQMIIIRNGEKFNAQGVKL